MSNNQSESTDKKNNWVNWITYCLLVLAINSIYLWAQYDVFSPDGSDGWLMVTMVLSLPFFVAVVFFIVSFIAFFFRSRRAEARKYLIASLIYIICVTGFGVAGANYRMHAYRDLAIKGEVIIEAIRLYEKQHDGPPESLADLVPGYLSEIPATGIGTHPEYGYIVSAAENNTGPQNSEATAVRWAIYVTAPSMATEWRCCLYVSDLRYDNIQAGFNFGEIEEDWVLFEWVPDNI